MKKTITIAVISSIIVGAAAFYSGMAYERNHSSFQNNSEQKKFGSGSGSYGRGQGKSRDGMGPGGKNGVSFFAGEIISKDEKSITIKNNEGSSMIVYFSDSTQMGKTVDGGSSDLENGKEVMINGEKNSDGSITAKNIQIRDFGHFNQ